MAAADLIERERELGTLRRLAGEAAAGDGRLVVVEGPAGIGKSRLLAELRGHAAADGMTVLTARGSELEREFGFGVVRQLFEAIVADPAGRDLLTGAAAPAGAVLGAPQEDDAAGASFAALHGLYWLVVNLAARRPVLLSVDDLHWSDRASLRFAAYLAHRLEGLPVMLACGLRSGEQSEDPALLAELERQPSLVAVHPAPLGESAVAEMLRGRLGIEPGPLFAAAVHRGTAGNPLLLRQLVAALADDAVPPDDAHAGQVAEIGPRAVSRAVLLRLARLDAAAADAARAVAILGESASYEAIAELTGLPEQQVADATAALVRADILRGTPPPGFVHPLVLDAVYADLAPAERQLAHGRAADLLLRRGAPAEQIAAQLLHAPPRGSEEAVAALRDAAREAARRGANESAAAYLQRALAEPPGEVALPGVLRDLGLAEALTSGPSAAAHLAAAYEGLDDPDDRAVVAYVLTRALLFTGRTTEAVAAAHGAAAALPARLAGQGRLMEAVALAAGYFPGGDVGALAVFRDYAVPAGGPADAGAKALAGMAAWEWTIAGRPAQDCCELALLALAGGDLLASDDGVVSVAPAAVLALADREEALAYNEEALAIAHRRGSLSSIAAVHLWFGFARVLRGELAEAEATLRACIEESELWGYSSYSAFLSGSLLSLARTARGDHDGAAQALTLGTGTDDQALGTTWHGVAHVAHLVATGRALEALQRADVLEQQGRPVRSPSLQPLGSLRAEALHALGRRDEALAAVDEELERARRIGAPQALARALRIRGTLLGAAGLPLLEEAVAVVDGSAARLEHARTLSALGSALRRARRPAEAREPLRRATELAASCAADGLVETARAELLATGARPRTTARTGLGALTPSERRVVDLAVEGQTNRDIAQALFVTPKTVEVHLSNAYRKLDVRSRHDLRPLLEAAAG